MKEWFAKFRNNITGEEISIRKLLSTKQSKGMLKTVGQTRDHLTLLEFWEIK